jgi:deoxyadenosine/deoxycytidine kinase
MSHTEKMNYIERLRKAIQSYRGFTLSEKQYAQKNIYEWIDNSGNLDMFIKKFAEISLDIQPFLVEKSFAKA